jgi:hypothetical protein
VTGMWVARYQDGIRQTKRHLVVSHTERQAKTACGSTVQAGKGTLVYEAALNVKRCDACKALT